VQGHIVSKLILRFVTALRSKGVTFSDHRVKVIKRDPPLKKRYVPLPVAR
jgi:hypothetical protein